MLTTKVSIKHSDLNFNHGRLLYSFLSNYINSEKECDHFSIVETGTARGFSSLCMSKALIDNDRSGHIVTLDCLPHNEKMYWNSISDHDGKFTRQELLKKWDKELSKIIFIQGWTIESLSCLGLQRINFAFLDAQHTKNSVLSEFLFISKKQLKGDMIFFDDVTPGLFDGVCKAVEIIEKNYPYKIKRLNIDSNRSYAVATKIN